ncbi:MAG: CARDB domain-containing protein [Candidatus Moraniibacteriota bacterium]
MEQEDQELEIHPEPEKDPGSKKFLIIIIAMLSVALVVLGAFYFYDLSKKSQVEDDNTKNLPTPSVSASPLVSPSPATITPTPITTPSPTAPAVVKKSDLYVKSYTLSEDPKVGSEFTATIVIGNKGQAASTETYWEWWATASKQICKKKVAAIAAGGISTVQCPYTYSDWSDYTTKAIVDSQNDLDESDENNNIITKQVKPIHGKPDLTVTDYDFNHDPAMGEEFKVEITIKNKGEIDAKSFKWEWWSTAYSASCDGEVDELEAGASTTVSCKYTYAGWSTYATKAVVDVKDDINEGNEGNNTSTKTVIPTH